MTKMNMEISDTNTENGPKKRQHWGNLFEEGYVDYEYI